MTDATPTPPVASAPSARVTLDDVRAVLDGTALNQTNASKVRGLLGNRGSLETIQKHLNTLRAEVAAAAAPAVAADQVPTPSADLVQSLWSHAWAAAQALVQTALAAAQTKAEALGQALGIAQADAVAAQQEADRARDELGAVQARLDGLEGQHADAVNRMQDAHQEQVFALRAGLSEARNEAEQARHELAVAQARHAADLAVLRGELDRQVSQLADLRAALQRPLTPVPEPVLSKQELGAS